MVSNRRQAVKLMYAMLIGLGWLSLSAAMTAVPTCQGKLASLQSYAGDYDGHKLLAEPGIALSLKFILGQALSRLRRNLSVAGPIDLISCHLVLEGNAPMGGGSENAIVDVALSSGAVVAAILSRGRIRVYVADGRYSRIPELTPAGWSRHRLYGRYLLLWDPAVSGLEVVQLLRLLTTECEYARWQVLREIVSIKLRPRERLRGVGQLERAGASCNSDGTALANYAHSHRCGECSVRTIGELMR